VARNIRYTNQHCTGNYRAYLAKALRADWGVALAEDEAQAQQAQAAREVQAQAEATRRRQEAAAIERDRELTRLARAYLRQLPAEAVAALTEEALPRLDPTLQPRALVEEDLASSLLWSFFFVDARVPEREKTLGSVMSALCSKRAMTSRGVGRQ
jgi:hypothetical protein